MRSTATKRQMAAKVAGYRKVVAGTRLILAGYQPQFEVDAGWPMVPLRDVVKLIHGGTPDQNNAAFWNGTIPWVSAKDMRTPELRDTELHVSESALMDSATGLAPLASVLVLVRGLELADGVPICDPYVRCAFSEDIKALRPKKGLASGYLILALRQEEAQLLSAMSTAEDGMLTIETTQLLKIQIPLPPPEEQCRIITELGVEAAQMKGVRELLGRFEAKLQRTLARVRGNGTEAA